LELIPKVSVLACQEVQFSDGGGFSCSEASKFSGTCITTAGLQTQRSVINVIDPTVEYAAKKYKKGKIGVIGTKATVNSRSYAKRIQKNNPNLKVSMLATPLLVSMIEEGFFNNRISQAIINNYLEKSTLNGIQALILGCTHFPLIKPEVESFYSSKTEVIDSSTIVAKNLQKELQKRGFSSSKLIGEHNFFVSEKTNSFEQSTKLFFGEKLKLEKKRLP